MIAFGMFAKPPVPGQVKTRLTPPLTPEQAAELYLAMIADTAESLDAVCSGRTIELRGPRGPGAGAFFATRPAGRPQPVTADAGGPPVSVDAEWFVFSTDPEVQEREWPAGAPRPRGWRPQVGDDLGARMLNAVKTLCTDGHDGAIIVGSDHPTVPPYFYAMAAWMLAATGGAPDPEPQATGRLPRAKIAAEGAEMPDVVLGPTFDGGYYLIGMREPQPALFESIPWSTPAVFELTNERAARTGLRVGHLFPWGDVDTIEDLRKLGHGDAMGREGALGGEATSSQQDAPGREAWTSTAEGRELPVAGRRTLALRDRYEIL